jgi:ribonuclease D
MLAYAAADTQHLTKLRDALSTRLSTLGRLTWAEEEFERLEELRWSGGGGIALEGKQGGEGEVQKDGAYLKLKGARTLKPRQLAALRELVRWREERAEAQDRAPFRIIGNEALLAVARALPATPEALARIPPSDLPESLANRHGIALLQTVARVLGLPESDLPVLERERRPPRDPEFETRLERLKAARNRVAAELQLEPGVLCGRAILEAVARARPADREALATVPGIRRWQIEVLGNALLAAL